MLSVEELQALITLQDLPIQRSSSKDFNGDASPDRKMDTKCAELEVSTHHDAPCSNAVKRVSTSFVEGNCQTQHDIFVQRLQVSHDPPKPSSHPRG